jgi:hypothetical protein
MEGALTRKKMLTNTLHLVIVPDKTRQKFMEEYPSALPSEFYQMLINRIGDAGTVPEYLAKEITITPPIHATRLLTDGVFVEFFGPDSSLMADYTYCWDQPLGPEQFDYRENAHIPRLGVLRGEWSFAQPPVERMYGYYMRYANLDFEMLDNDIINEFMTEKLPNYNPLKPDVSLLRFPEQRLVELVIERYLHNTHSPQDIRNRRLQSVESNTKLAIEAGMHCLLCDRCSPCLKHLHCITI